VTRTAIRTCPLCEATCGLQLTVEGERITAVRGDRDDVFSGGYLCPKGALFGELEADPDRLTAPLVRRDGQLVEVSWDEAYDEVARRLPAIQAEHGADSVAVYLGNPNVHTLAGQLYVRPLVKALRTHNVHSASSVDQLPKHVSCGLLFGDPLAIPVPDVDRCELLVVLGGNPRVSNGSLWTAPELPGRLTDLQDRGRLVVVDPMRTRTAAKADEHLAIRPGTDAALLAAIVTTLAADDAIRLPEHLVDLVDDAELASLVDALAWCTAEVAADVCDVPAERIRELAHALVTTERACVYGRLGTTTVRFGTLTSALVDVVNLVTGNLDVPGGAMLPLPAHHRGRRRPFRMGRWHSRVRGLPEAIGELPVAALVDELVTPGEGQVRAMVVVAGNPVVSTPDSDALDAALADLDLLVCVDPYLTATSRHADVVLPPPPASMRGHYDLAFSGLAIRNVANYSAPVFPLADDRPDEWRILLTLAAIAMGVPTPVDTDAADAFVLQQAIEGVLADPDARLQDRDAGAIAAALGDVAGPERLLDLLLRAGPYGDGFGAHPDGLSLEVLRANPHGIDLGALQPRLPDALRTASGRIELGVPLFRDEADRLRASVEEERDDDRLVLIGRRHLRTNNSWSHNVAGLAKGQQLCTLQVHPDDADRLGLEDGGRATVRSSVGQVEVDVEVWPDLRPGVVSLPHGFGHDRDGVRLRVARAAGGVTSNVLTDRRDVDPVSGTAVLNGIRVEVAPAVGRTTDDQAVAAPA
jgi:anaerobic selenocysteine-containing dehydrogenase